MPVLVVGLLAFFGIHSVRIVASGFRDEQIAANTGRWKGIYSLVSLAGLVLIIFGWMLYRPTAEPVFEPPVWGRHAAVLLVWIGFVLNAAAYGKPTRIKAAVKHPMLLGVMAWALGHLLANGDLASVLLFGSFLIYTVIDRIAMARRPSAPIIVSGLRADVIALVTGTALYLLFLFVLHPVLFGVSPLA